MALSFSHLSGSLYITGSVSSSLGFSGSIDYDENLIDHNALVNYTASRHVDHSAVSINTSTGLSGGGTLETTRTILFDGVGTTVVSSSAQVLTLTTGSGIVSSSAQIDTNFFDIDGLVSSSAQVITLTSGSSIFSGSVQIDHDSTTNFVANEHVDHSTITVGSGKGLSGGGTIDTSRSLTLDTGSSHFSDGVVGVLPAGTVSGSSLSSPNQGTVKLTTNGVAGGNVDTGLQTGDSPTFSGLTLSSLSNQASEATAVMINGSNILGTRELGTNAFNSTTFVDISGTPADNQIAVFTDANTVEGTSNLTYDGELVVGTNISGSGLLNIQGTGTSRFNSHLQAHCIGIGTTPSGTTGEIRAAGDITAYYSSDNRLKENISNIDEPLKKLSYINGVEFDWIPKEGIHSNEGHDIGVIAQEIEKILPELVTTRENGYKAVRYEKIVALLIEAVKEQQSQIDELKNKL